MSAATVKTTTTTTNKIKWKTSREKCEGSSRNKNKNSYLLMRFSALGSTMIEPDAVFPLLLAVVQNDSKPVRQKTWLRKKTSTKVRETRERELCTGGETPHWREINQMIIQLTRCVHREQERDGGKTTWSNYDWWTSRQRRQQGGAV